MKHLISPRFNNILNLFNGNWNIFREIINYEDNQLSAIAIGTASFYKQSNTSLLLQERVTVNWSNRSTSLATKSYLFEQKNNLLLKYYFKYPINLVQNKQLNNIEKTEKILMHTLLLSRSKSKFFISSNSLHYCGMDQYKLSFIILSHDSFLMNYQISGPYKNSYVNSTYTRINSEINSF